MDYYGLPCLRNVNSIVFHEMEVKWNHFFCDNSISSCNVIPYRKENFRIVCRENGHIKFEKNALINVFAPIVPGTGFREFFRSRPFIFSEIIYL
jgi:hypothetical protein